MQSIAPCFGNRRAQALERAWTDFAGYVWGSVPRTRDASSAAPRGVVYAVSNHGGVTSSVEDRSASYWGPAAVLQAIRPGTPVCPNFSRREEKYRRRATMLAGPHQLLYKSFSNHFLLSSLILVATDGRRGQRHHSLGRLCDRFDRRFLLPCRPKTFRRARNAICHRGDYPDCRHQLLVPVLWFEI